MARPRARGPEWAVVQALSWDDRVRRRRPDQDVSASRTEPKGNESRIDRGTAASPGGGTLENVRGRIEAFERAAVRPVPGAQRIDLRRQDPAGSVERLARRSPPTERRLCRRNSSWGEVSEGAPKGEARPI